MSSSITGRVDVRYVCLSVALSCLCRGVGVIQHSGSLKGTKHGQQGVTEPKSSSSGGGGGTETGFRFQPRQNPFLPIQISLAMEMYGQWKLPEPLGRRFEAGPSLCLRRSRSIGRPLRHERQLLAFVKQRSRDTYRPQLFSFIFLVGSVGAL